MEKEIIRANKITMEEMVENKNENKLKIDN